MCRGCELGLNLGCAVGCELGLRRGVVRRGCDPGVAPRGYASLTPGCVLAPLQGARGWMIGCYGVDVGMIGWVGL